MGVYAGIGGRTTGSIQVEAKLIKEKTLIDVDLHILQTVASAWVKRAYGTSRIGSLHGPSLYFPPIIDQSYSGLVSLCVVSNEKYPLTAAEKFAVRHAFKFAQKSKTKPSLTSRTSLDLLVEGAISAARGLDSVAFDESVNQLVSLHTTLLAVGETSSNAGPSNYALIHTGSFASSWQADWSRAYVPLFDVTIEKLDVESQLFAKGAYVAYRIVQRVLSLPSKAGAQEAIEMQAYLWFRLNAWWEGKAAVAGLGHGPADSVILTEPNKGTFNSVHRKFVEGWESVSSWALRPAIERANGWFQMVNLIGILTTQLHHTARMLCQAALTGNVTSGEQWVDYLLHWQSNAIPLSWHSDIVTLNAAQRLLLTPSVTGEDWKTVESQFRDRSSFPFQEISRGTVYSGLIVTVWNDTCHVIVNMLLTWALYQSVPAKSAPALIAKALIDGRTLDKGGNHNSADFLGTFSDFLLSFLRRHAQFEWAQNGLDRHYHHLAEQIDHLTDVPGMSGRTYVTAGFSQSSSYDGEMLLGCLCATGTVDIAKSLSAQFPEILHDNGLSEHLQNELSAFIAHIDGADTERFTPLFEYLSGTRSQIMPVGSQDDQTADVTAKISHVLMEQRLGNLRSSLLQIREAIVNFRADRLRKTPVSPSKMAEVASKASTSGFTKETAEFPISLFSSVEMTGQALTPFTLTNDNFPKGALTDPELDQVHFSEDHHASVVKPHLNQRAIVDIFLAARRLNIIRQVEAPDQDVYAYGIKKIFDLYRNAGLRPFAIIEDYDSPPWISDWQNTWMPDRKVPDGIEIVNDFASKPAGALFTIDGVPFYNGHVAFGGTLILPQEALKTFKFRQFAADKFVDVEFRDDNVDPSMGTLVYYWEREVELTEFPIFLLSYPNES